MLCAVCFVFYLRFVFCFVLCLELCVVCFDLCFVSYALCLVSCDLCLARCVICFVLCFVLRVLFFVLCFVFSILCFVFSVLCFACVLFLCFVFRVSFPCCSFCAVELMRLCVVFCAFVSHLHALIPLLCEIIVVWLPLVHLTWLVASLLVPALLDGVIDCCFVSCWGVACGGGGVEARVRWTGNLGFFVFVRLSFVWTQNKYTYDMSK